MWMQGGEPIPTMTTIILNHPPHKLLPISTSYFNSHQAFWDRWVTLISMRTFHYNCLQATYKIGQVSLFNTSIEYVTHWEESRSARKAATARLSSSPPGCPLYARTVIKPFGAKTCQHKLWSKQAVNKSFTKYLLLGKEKLICGSCNSTSTNEDIHIL